MSRTEQKQHTSPGLPGGLCRAYDSSTLVHGWIGNLSVIVGVAARSAGAGSGRLKESVMAFYTDDSPGLKIPPVSALIAWYLCPVFLC